MREATFDKEVEERQKLAKQIINAAKEYAEDIKSAAKYYKIPSISAFEPFIDQLESTKVVFLDKSIENIALAYRSAEKTQYLMEKVMDFINDYDIFNAVSAAVSQTKLAAINLYRADIQSAWNTFARTAADSLHALLNSAVLQVIEKVEVRLAINYVTTQSPDDFITAVISKLLSRGVDPTERKLLIATIDKRLENMFQKDQANAPGFLSRHGLTPGQSMSLRDLLLVHKPDTTETDIESGKVAGETLVLIEYSTKNAIEFSIDRLISQKIIEDESLELPGGTGLTKKVLKRYATTTLLPGQETPWKVTKIPGELSEMTIFESISPNKWRLLAKGYRGDIDATTRPEIYNEWASAEMFYDQHPYIVQKIKVRKPAEPIAEYDAMGQFLIDNYAKSMPHNAKKYKSIIYKRSRIEKAMYAAFIQRSDNIEATISYMLKIEPTVELMYAELSYRASKYEPQEGIFHDMKVPDIKEKLFSLYKQIVSEAIDAAKTAHWLDDYNSTYKSVYMGYIDDGYIKPQ